MFTYRKCISFLNRRAWPRNLLYMSPALSSGGTKTNAPMLQALVGLRWYTEMSFNLHHAPEISGAGIQNGGLLVAALPMLD